MIAPLLHTLFGEFDGLIYSFGSLPGDSRLWLYCVSLYIPCLIIAASFPVDVASPAGQRFAFVPTVCCGTLRCIGVGLDIYHTGTHVNLSLIHI